METGRALHHENPYASGEKQSAINSLGMWIFLAGEVLFFGALFTGYMVMRLKFPDSFAEASSHLDVILGTINTALLLTSSLMMALAVNSAQRGNNRALFLLLMVTILLGAVFLGIKFYEYADKISEGLLPDQNFTWEGENPFQARVFFSLYFMMTGLHAVHMLIGIGFMLVMAFLALRKRFSAAYYAPVEMTGLFWHFVDIVWIFLFPMLYLIERSL